MARAKKTLADLQELVDETAEIVAETETETETSDDDEAEGQFEFLPSRNVRTVDEMNARIDELAILSAKGEDALPNLGLEIASWAAQGLISAKAPSKKEPDAPDAVRLAYLRYAETRRNNSVNGNAVAAKRSTDAQVSKLRIFAKVGERQDIDAADFFFNVIQARNAFDGAGLATKGPYIALQDAGKKVAGKRELTEEELREAILKKPAAARTALSVWKAIQNNVKALIEEDLENTPEVHQLRDMVAAKVTFHDQLAKFLSISESSEKFGFKIVKLDDQPNSADEASE